MNWTVDIGALWAVYKRRRVLNIVGVSVRRELRGRAAVETFVLGNKLS